MAIELKSYDANILQRLEIHANGSLIGTVEENNTNSVAHGTQC